MQRVLQRVFGSGNVPYVLVVAVAGSTFAAGRLTAPPPPVATAEASALVLRTALEHPELTTEQLEVVVQRPIAAVIQNYARRGHIVVDLAPDEAGRLGLMAVPPNTVDITAELQAAVLAARVPPASAAQKEAR